MIIFFIVNINSVNNEGNTVLHELCKNTYNDEYIPILIENGASKNKKK